MRRAVAAGIYIDEMLKLASAQKKFEVGDYVVYLNYARWSEGVHKFGCSFDVDTVPKTARVLVDFRFSLAHASLSVSRRYKPITPENVHASHPMKNGKCAQCLRVVRGQYVDYDLQYPCDRVYNVSVEDVHPSHTLDTPKGFLGFGTSLEGQTIECKACGGVLCRTPDYDTYADPKLIKHCVPAR